MGINQSYGVLKCLVLGHHSAPKGFKPDITIQCLIYYHNTMLQFLDFVSNRSVFESIQNIPTNRIGMKWTYYRKVQGKLMNGTKTFLRYKSMLCVILC